MWSQIWPRMFHSASRAKKLIFCFFTYLAIFGSFWLFMHFLSCISRHACIHQNFFGIENDLIICHSPLKRKILGICPLIGSDWPIIAVGRIPPPPVISTERNRLCTVGLNPSLCCSVVVRLSCLVLWQDSSAHLFVDFWHLF